MMKSLALLALLWVVHTSAFLPQQLTTTTKMMGSSCRSGLFVSEDDSHIQSFSSDVEVPSPSSLDMDYSSSLPTLPPSLTTTDTPTRRSVGLVSTVLAPRRRVGFILSKIATFITGLGGFVAEGIAADEMENYAELPPPYIPAIFGVVLLAGVGILTSSLGDVMDEEASLGLQSGARAKKEIERSRSSYFGKRN
jgi:hypothetical protein